MQRQAVLQVRLVIGEEQTLDEAEEIVTEALEVGELIAHVQALRIEIVEES